MQSSITNGFAVGDCQVIPELGLLTGPTGVHVPNPRILRLLEVLACKAGDVVDRPLMCKTLDHSAANPDRVLTRCIGQLRRYLGDDARRPRYLETVPGRGYRLIAPISALAADRVADLSSSIVRPNGHAARLVKFFHDLQQRRVCRAVIIYAAVVWLSVQIAETVFPPLGLGDAPLICVVVIGIAGFPIVALLAWIFELTPEGLVVDIPISTRRAERKRPIMTGRLDSVSHGNVARSELGFSYNHSGPTAAGQVPVVRTYSSNTPGQIAELIRPWTG